MAKDSIIVLEAGTIIGPFVARATQERKIPRRYNIWLQAEHFLVVEGYDPRIHAVYFCPQLYKFDSEKKLVPLQGDEIGRLIANALEGGIVDRRPWYDPAEKLPDQPIISSPLQTEYDSLFLEMPARNFSTPGLKDGRANRPSKVDRGASPVDNA